MRKKVLLPMIVFFMISDLCAIIPDRTYFRMPEQLGLMYKELAVKTKDGYEIATWFFPVQKEISSEQVELLNGQKRDYQAEKNRKYPTIVICNGDAGNMSYFQLHLAQAYTQRGFNVVSFDWRGFGKSTPFEMDKNYLCYTQLLEDYSAVLEVVVNQPEVKKQSIAVMGWSTGAYLSMITAYTHREVAAFVGRSLATDFDDFIPLVMQVRKKTRDQVIIPPDFPREMMPVFIASKFTKPIFLVNGEKDIRTPVWMSEKVLSLLPRKTPRELLVVKGAGHGGKEDPMILDFDHFIDRSATFLKVHLK